MKYERLTDLLPAYAQSSQPNAYQVVGLQGPTADMNQVLSAIKSTIARLQEAKPESDPAAWKQAAESVRDARAILADPVRKAALDEQVTPPAASPSENTPQDADFDPLAGILPTTNPLQSAPASPKSPDPVNPAAPIPTPVSARAEVPAAEAPVAKIPVADIPTAAIPVAEIPVARAASVEVPAAGIPAPTIAAPQIKKRTVRRRRGSPLLAVLMGAAVLGLFALVSILGYALLVKKQTVAITKTADGVQVQAGDAPESGRTQISRPMPVNEAKRKRPRDPVMGGLLPAEIDPDESGTPGGLPRPSSMGGGLPPAGDPGSFSMPAAPPENPITSPPGSMVENQPDPGPSSATTGMTPPGSPDADQIKRNQIALNQVAQLIRDRDWQRMVGAAEAARDLPLTDEQSETAEGLYTTAFLFEYYRGGIERGMALQQIGMSFELAPGLAVGVASSGNQNGIDLKIDGKVKSFELESLPYTLADRLAAQSIDQGPTRDLAAAIYHCLSATATGEVRQSELAWIRGFDQVIEDADPSQVADAIEIVVNGP